MSAARHHLVALIAVLALVAGVSACGDGASGAEVLESDVSRSKASVADASAGAATSRHVAAQLYGLLAAEADADTGNLAYSPVSIAVALGMVRAGASGASADQLDELLGSSDTAALHLGLNGLDTVMATRAGTRKNSKDLDSEVALEMANSLWGHKGVVWEDPFLDVLKRDYGVGLHVVDYEKPDSARRAINSWIADRTHDKIPDLLPEGALKPITRLTLVNALYFKAPWFETLDEAPSQPFTTAAGTEVSAEMMKTDEMLAYQAGNGWQSVTLTYAGEELAMTLLVPDAGQLAGVETGLDGELLAKLLTPGPPRTVHLTMPKFDLDHRASIGAAMKALGVTEPFETDKDFDPMSSDPDARPLRLDDILHQATVTIDEKGTEAAAATAAIFETVGARIGIEPVELVVDRPFLFLIHDIETRAPLFVGRVGDPTAK